MSLAFEIDVRMEHRTRRGAAFVLQAAFRTRGGITVVFGPSGSGKTTLLLAILGAADGVRGRVGLGTRVLLDSNAGTNVPVHSRRIGIVFQDALLFPHLEVTRNVAFGVRGDHRRKSISVARSCLERVGAAELASRLPSELSGGQRQRVALARALAADPDALLLDEPFSALDARSRESLGDMLVELQRETGVPFVHVTHDLPEAIRLGNEIVILDAGEVVQQGSPAQVLAAPRSSAAARAIGTENLFEGTVAARDPARGLCRVDLGGTLVETGLLGIPPGERVALGLRAEDVLLSVGAIGETSARNVIAGTIESVAERGGSVRVEVATPVVFRVIVTPASAGELDLRPGRRVHLVIKAHAFHRLI